MAIAALGPRLPGPRVSHEMSVPVLRRSGAVSKPSPSHVDAAIYQLGRPRKVTCHQNVLQVTTGPALHIHWLRNVLREREAVEEVDALQDLFTQQIAPGAPVHGRRQGNHGQGTPQQPAQGRHKAANKK